MFQEDRQHERPPAAVAPSMGPIPSAQLAAPDALLPRPGGKHHRNLRYRSLDQHTRGDLSHIEGRRPLVDRLLRAVPLLCPLEHRPHEIGGGMALGAVDQPGGDNPAGVALELVADNRPFAVRTRFDGPASADVRHAHIAAVRRWARVIRTLDEDLVTIDSRVHAFTKPNGVVAVPYEGQRELLVGNTLVSRVREDSELLEVRDELQV